MPLTDEHWTTPEIVRLEQQVVDLAVRPASDRHRADPAAVAAAVDDRPSLSDEQRRMVDQLCLAGRPVDVVIGRAGTGKTFTLDAVRAAFQASGHQVTGVSLAARAARELQAGAGIQSTTAHALHGAIESGRVRLQPNDVLVIDEAGMIGTRFMAALAAEAGRADAKLILVGDPKQLPAVEAGGLLAALAARVDLVELVENRRQLDPHEQFVSTMLRRGQPSIGVEALQDQGHLTTAHNSDVLRDHLVHGGIPPAWIRANRRRDRK